MTPLVLAIDTSGPVTGLGVGRADQPGFSVAESGGRKHAEVIDTLMGQVLSELSEQRPDAIAVGVGPGPYSGLRVGIAFAIGLGRAWSRPVLGVCSHDAIAWAVTDSHLLADGFVVTTDARRSEIYWARYDSSALRTSGPQVISVDAMDFDLPIIADQQVDTAVMAARVSRSLADGLEPVPTTAQWAPHGADGSQVAVPQGPLLVPHPLYLRAPDITISAKTPTGRSS